MAKRKSKIKLISALTAAMLIAIGVAVSFLLDGKEDAFTHAGLADPAKDDGKMYVNFIDVGQGDCTLITCGGKTILIDGGEYAQVQKVTNYLLNKRIKRIDLCIATHPHSDHIGSLGTVLRKFKVGDVIMPEIPESIIPTSAAYEKFMLAVSDCAENVYAAEVGKTYKYGDMEIQILAPVRDYSDLNNMSAVARITYGDTAVMMMGDAEAVSETDILKNDFDFSAQLMKAGHHGSKKATCAKWLAAVNPQYAVISCGKDNEYGHPHTQTINRLDKHGVKYFRTDVLGDIVFVSDGKTFTRVEK